MPTNEKTQEIVSAVAKALGSDWTHISTHCDVLRRDDGLELFFNSGHYGSNGKFSISQSFNNSAWIDSEGNHCDPTSPSQGLPSINVSEKKPPATIARDILRRLLPDCEPLHARALNRVKERNAYTDSKNAICAEFGIKVVESRHGREIYRDRTWNFGDDAKCEIKPDGANCVQMELRDLTVEQGKAVLAALNLKI